MYQLKSDTANKIRNPKHEILNKSEYQMIQIQKQFRTFEF
jgi:hypothetical protein